MARTPTMTMGAAYEATGIVGAGEGAAVTTEVATAAVNDGLPTVRSPPLRKAAGALNPSLVMSGDNFERVAARDPLATAAASLAAAAAAMSGRAEDGTATSARPPESTASGSALASTTNVRTIAAPLIVTTRFEMAIVSALAGVPRMPATTPETSA